MDTPARPTLGPDGIRFFKIRQSDEPELALDAFDFPRSDPPPYIAISYVWGDRRNTHSIPCNGLPLSITFNLYEALQIFRVSLADRDPLLWADAICINQESTSEKSHQVQHMDKTFRKADEVLAWLGPEENNSKLVFDDISDVLDALKTAYFDATRRDLLSAARVAKYNIPGEHDPFWTALAYIYDRPWFHRVWTFQENVLAQKLTLCCGQQRMEWQDLADVAWVTSDLGIMHWSSSLPGRMDCDGFTSVFFCRSFRNKLSMGQEINYGMTIALMRQKFVSDERDRIYGILSLFGTEVSKKIEVDYSFRSDAALLELFVTAGKVSMMTQGSRLYMLEGPNHAGAHTPGLPTWCPDPRRSCRTSFSGLRYEWLRAGIVGDIFGSDVTVSPPGASWIEIAGLYLDAISEVGVESRDEDDRCNSNDARAALRWEREALTLARKVCTTCCLKTGSGDEVVPIQHIYTMAGVHPYEILDEGQMIQQYTAAKALTEAMAAEDVANYGVVRSTRHGFDCFGSWRRQLRRRYFTTTGGRVGMGTEDMKPGDFVAALMGGRPVFILRPCSDSILEGEDKVGATFVGDAFVHGFMDLATTRREIPDVKIVKFRIF